MRKKILIPALLITFAFSSCEKFLDVKPTGKLIPTEAGQLDKLLNHANTYQFFFQDNNRGSSLGFMGDNLEISYNQDAYMYGISSPNMDRYASYIFHKPFSNPTGAVHYFWEYGAKPILHFNQVIEGMKDLVPAEKDTDFAKGVVAQAKAGRAFNMMTAALVYGPMWDPSGDNGTRVIPYRTSPSPTDPNPDLSTTEELFGLIWTDLEEAIAAIPEQVSTPTRPNKAAVHAIRALFYMYKRDWPNMLSEANSAWTLAGGDADRLIYDLNDFEYKYIGTPPVDGTDHEVTLTLEYKPNLAEPFSDPKSRENLYYRECPSTSGAYLSDNWLALFDQATDLRYKLFVLKGTGYSSSEHDDGIRLYYYRSSKMQMNAGITYPEVLLMRAEAYARTDRPAEALADLNTLRKYRYERADSDPEDINDHPDGATLLTDKDKLISEILKERRREQPTISYKRMFDIKRYVYDTGKEWSQTVLTNKIGTKVYTMDITDKTAMCYPISNLIIDYNPHWGLTKYEGTWDPKNP